MYKAEQCWRLVLGQNPDCLNEDADENSKKRFISNPKLHHERQGQCQRCAEHDLYRECRFRETSGHILFVTLGEVIQMLLFLDREHRCQYSGCVVKYPPILPYRMLKT